MLVILLVVYECSKLCIIIVLLFLALPRGVLWFVLPSLKIVAREVTFFECCSAGTSLHPPFAGFCHGP